MPDRVRARDPRTAGGLSRTSRCEIIPYRYYPDGSLAAHVLGYVGQVSGPAEAKKHPGLRATTTRSGARASRPRTTRTCTACREQEKVAVDPAGRVVGDPVVTTQGRPGRQRAAHDQRARAEDRGAVARSRASSSRAPQQNKEVKKLRLENYKAPGGSVVVLDANTGGVVAMASYPTYAPSEFVGGITQAAVRDRSPRRPARLLEPRDAGSLRGRFDVQAHLVDRRGAEQLPRRVHADRTTTARSPSPDRRSRTRTASRTASSTCARRSPCRATCTSTHSATTMWNTWKAGEVQRGYAIQNVAP